MRFSSLSALRDSGFSANMKKTKWSQKEKKWTNDLTTESEFHLSNLSSLLLIIEWNIIEKDVCQ